MVWRVNKIGAARNSLVGDVMFQKTNLLFNIHSLDYTAFDMYYLWRIGVNIINVDRTIHDEDFFKKMVAKVNEGRDYNNMGHYRPIGVAVTVSANTNVEIDDDADVVIVKDIATKEDLIEFKKKNLNLYTKPTLVWISSYNLDDLHFIIKISDGVVLNFHDEKKVVQKYCFRLFQKCREVHKPIILYRPDLTKQYLDKVRELLPRANELVEMNLDGILLEDNEDSAVAIDGIYSMLCAMHFTEKNKEKSGEVIDAFLKLREEVKLPVLPPLSVALGASLAALHSCAALIMVLTRSGRSAKWISTANPPCPILAISRQRSTTRLLHVYKKVMPLLYEEAPLECWRQERRKRIRFGTDFATKIGLVGNDAKLVVISPHGYDGYSNSFQIVTAFQILNSIQ